jgi:1,5-anhydro-D-fructose reductase (1,5-anhydro-D-mannitol-forming)
LPFLAVLTDRQLDQHKDLPMIRIGIVGCGRILNAHLQGYRRLREAGFDNFRITALCARNPNDALMFRKRGEGPPPRPPVLDPATGDPLAAPHIYLSDFQPDTEVAIFTDFREMIDSRLVDAVNDFTSLFLHHQVGLYALERGQHLLVQKPLTITVKAGRQLVEAAHSRGLTLGVFENVRQDEQVRASHWTVQQGIIGEIQMALIGGIGGFWSPDKVVAETPWRHHKLEGGGGGTIDIGVHVMHWLRYVCGDIASVHAAVRTFEPVRYTRDTQGQIINRTECNVDDTYFATVNFQNGAIGQLLWSWGARGEPLEIPGTPAFFGSKGCIKGDAIILDAGGRTTTLALFRKQADAAVKQRFFPHGFTDPYTIQQYDWLTAIERGGQPETDGAVGLADLAAAFAMIEASQLGRTVTLDEVLSGEVDHYQREINQYYNI